MERKKEVVGEGRTGGSQKKKLEKREEQLKNYNKDLTMVYRSQLILDDIDYFPLGQNEVNGSYRIYFYCFIGNVQYNVCHNDQLY